MLDIVNINYSGSFLTKKHESISVDNFLNNIINLIKYLVKALYLDVRNFNWLKVNRNKALCFSTSQNQLNILRLVDSLIEDSELVGINTFSNYRIPQFPGFILSFIFFPLFAYQLYFNREHRIQIINNLPDYFFINGTYYWWYLIIRIKKPSCLIMSNDHLNWHRILIKICKQLDIPTVYIQHASIADTFPKLEFDLNLLEGNDAKRKYEKIGKPSGSIKLVGMLKFDEYSECINNNTKVTKIGICTNDFDEEKKILELVDNITGTFSNVTIIYRPHPGDLRQDLIEKLRNYKNLEFSDSTREKSFEYLKKVDIVIAADTSMHLEAAIMNVYPIYCRMSSDVFDFYGFIQNGLIKTVIECSDDLDLALSTLIDNKPQIRSNAKEYIDTIDTEYDGKSGELVRKEILNFLGNG